MNDDPRSHLAVYVVGVATVLVAVFLLDGPSVGVAIRYAGNDAIKYLVLTENSHRDH